MKRFHKQRDIEEPSRLLYFFEEAICMKQEGSF